MQMAKRVASAMANSKFSVVVAKENLKFSAAHFMAYPGFREALHGHNYQVGVRIEGRLAPTGYVLDFGLVKEIVREIVGSLDERTLLPAESDCLEIERWGDQRVAVRFGEDEFIFPASDVRLLPIVHSSAEELARFICGELRRRLAQRSALEGLAVLEISVAEAPGQAAVYREMLTDAAS
jgi:6-pyruvoyltetrahydropterin/6-carboxytetrahydropterin synthase